MITGLGVDACEIARIARALAGATGARFRARVFTDAERRYCDGRGRASAQSYAACFAAKEAALKALGTGWADGLAWQDVEVGHDAAGAPLLLVHGKAEAVARSRGIDRLHVTLSHVRTLAVAVVIAERIRRPGARAGKAAAGAPRRTRRPRAR